MEILDHRTIKSEISVGGTDCPFVLEATGEYGFVAKLASMTNTGGGAEIEGLYDAERLFRVRFPNSMETTYDYSGNLVGFEMNLALLFNDMPHSVVGQMDRELMMSLRRMFREGSDLVVRVYLKDGLATRAMNGWLQVVPGRNIEQVDSSSGGVEIVAGSAPRAYSVGINNGEDEGQSVIYVVSGLVDDSLVIGAGDGKTYFMMAFRRLVDPEMIGLAKTPQGAKALLTQIQSEEIE